MADRPWRIKNGVACPGCGERRDALVTGACLTFACCRCGSVMKRPMSDEYLTLFYGAGPPTQCTARASKGGDK
jgi:hypothetical protein